MVMAGRSAAASPWVRQEIDWWLTHRSADTQRLALTDGTLVRDRERASFDWSRSSPCCSCSPGLSAAIHGHATR
ncbi:hypothetical protein ACIQFU_08440 [Streptomyces sp. NPDC093065]|uniref:hypothetical protein n=1 Tax=Streptomyces sp. NPDC093065 TaxID=3366021 RepID=UPI003809B628